MRGFEPCECGSDTFVARASAGIATVLDASGDVLDRSVSEDVEGVECESCGRVVRREDQLAEEDVDLILDGE